MILPVRVERLSLCPHLEGGATIGAMKHLFLDESGSHNLRVVDPDYPVFVLGGVIIGSDEELAATLSAGAELQEPNLW